jgi:ATP-binding cassette subfamily B protein
VRRLLALAWQFRSDCLLSVLLSLALLLLGLAGLQFLGVVIDVIRHALDPSQRAPVYPFGWRPPSQWTPIQIVTALSGGIVLQAVLRAWLTYKYNMVTARLTQGKIVPGLRDRLYARLQLLSFRFFDVHGSSSIFNRVTGDVQNTRLFVDGVVLQGLNMILTLGAYFIFMWRIHAALTVACLSVTLGLWWVTHYYSGRLRPAYLRNRELFDRLVELFTESVRGMQTVKGFAAEPPGVGSATTDLSGSVCLHSRNPDLVTIKSRDPVRIRRVAVRPGKHSSRSGISSFRRSASAIQRAGGKHHHHRELCAAELCRRSPRIRGAGYSH